MILKHIQYNDDTHQLVLIEPTTGFKMESEIEDAPIPIVMTVKDKVFVAISDFFDEAEGVYCEKVNAHRENDGETMYII